jgi:hypothetical protein
MWWTWTAPLALNPKISNQSRLSGRLYPSVSSWGRHRTLEAMDRYVDAHDRSSWQSVLISDWACACVDYPGRIAFGLMPDGFRPCRDRNQQRMFEVFGSAN